jgi:hypothetical protein
MSRVPCCKVCKDAGKPAAQYESHWPKDSSGNTICPTLLSQECRFCRELGHTTKYCSKLPKQKTYTDRKPTPKPETKKPEIKKKKGSIYADAFGSDSEDEDEEGDIEAPPTKKQVAFSDFPPLGDANVPSTIFKAFSYAAAAAMVVPTEKKAPTTFIGTKITIADITPVKPTVVTDYEEDWENKKHLFAPKKTTRPWYESDSEDDDDDDDDESNTCRIQLETSF